MAKRAGDSTPVVVAVDKDKPSQHALKWAVEYVTGKGEYVTGKGQPLTLLHIKTRPSSGSNSDAADIANRELFLPFRCFCSRKDVKCNEVIYEDIDIAKGIVDYVNEQAIEVLVIGASVKSGLFRFKTMDVATSVFKIVPEFCSVYVISKTKVSVVKHATSPTKHGASTNVSTAQPDSPQLSSESYVNQIPKGPSMMSRNMPDELDFRSPFNRPGAAGNRPYVRSAAPSQCDISFVSSARPSVDVNTFGMNFDCGEFERMSNASEFDARIISMGDFSTESPDRLSVSVQNIEDIEAEMRRLKLELKQTIDMYSTACKEALNAKQKAHELHQWKIEEQQRFEEARLAEEAALELAEREKMKCKAALEAAEAAQKIAEREAQRRINAERKALREAEERKKIMMSLSGNDCRYRKYSIEEIEAATDNFASNHKIGEGGYGPVYKGELDHTPVAIKALRPDASQGRSQFHQEVEVLCCIRHPNMVLLLGACPEYGCLVYEYMANGSLEDRLFRRGNTPVIPWQLRFRIAAEIGTGLLFLHQTKPEPLVHRDLKPANILLDRNYVSKISDVGLARLVPPSVVDTVTQYRMTSAAGTFCYIDPEYQQTGMLGIKSDIYSLGIMFLQIITAKPPMGLTHVIERAIERGTFAAVLDPAVTDWPVDEALTFAKLALKCAELRRKDRPDLGKVILPELNRLRLLGEITMQSVPPHLLNGTDASL